MAASPARRPTAPGYSGKPLADKIGVTAEMRIAVRHAPPELRDWLGPLPPGAAIVGPRATAVGCVIHFAVGRSVLMRETAGALKQLGDGGMYWVCWPKKTSGVATDVTEDVIRATVLPTGWVDVKVCAVSEIWSGLKFLRRRRA